MTTIFRYILGGYLRVFFLAMGAFLVLFQVFDFIERYDYYFKFDPDAIDVFSLILLKTIPAFTLSIPVATLLASVISLAVFNRNSELIAMRASGIGFIRIAHPLLWCGLLASIATLTLNEFLLPRVNEQIRYLELIKIRQNEELTFLKKDQIWFKDESKVFNIDLFMPTEGLMRGISYYELDDSFRPIRRTYASEGRLSEGNWAFSGIQTVEYGEGATISAGGAIPFRYGVESLSVIEKRPDEMTFRELRRFIRKLANEGLPTHVYLTDLYARIAFSVIALLLALVGLPFSTRPPRHGGAMVAIALAIAVGFSYWVLLSLGVTLGKNQILAPWLAAWSPNLLFGGLAIFFFRRMG